VPFLTSLQPRENAVDHTSAVTTPAPSSTTATAKPASFIEHYIGLQVAGAASLLLLALEEYGDGGLSPRTKEQSGQLFFELFRLHQFMLGHGDFNAIARRHGVAVLRKDDIKLATAEAAVDEVLQILAQVVKSQLS
jgi:hypothetical protein